MHTHRPKSIFFAARRVVSKIENLPIHTDYASCQIAATNVLSSRGIDDGDDGVSVYTIRIFIFLFFLRTSELHSAVKGTPQEEKEENRAATILICCANPCPRETHIHRRTSPASIGEKASASSVASPHSPRSFSLPLPHQTISSTNFPLASSQNS
jgi:hypothetical protein